MGMIALFIALTVHMPIMIMIYGKVSASHIIVGYIGLFCYGSAAAAIGIFGSSLVRSQVFAVILSGGLIAFLALIFRLSEITEPPFSSLLEYAALYNKHMPPFHKGLLGLDHLIYYVSVTWLFLVFSVRALDRRRWQ